MNKNSLLNNYIRDIGGAISEHGNELQKQAQSNQPLNIHSQVKQTTLDLQRQTRIR